MSYAAVRYQRRYAAGGVTAALMPRCQARRTSEARTGERMAVTMSRDDATLSTGGRLHDLKLFYRPRSIAVVGAHDSRPGLVGVTEKAIAHAGRCGASFHPVNPGKDTIFGYQCVASVADLDGPIDVIVVLVADAIGVVEQVADAGLEVGFFLVFSNGFAELGTPEGSARERALVDAVRRAGARLIGPNTNANAWDPLADLPGRRLAVISQSGVQGRALTQAQDLGIALSYWAPTGNEADLEAADFIEFFVADDDTAAICAYIEGFKSGASLRRAALAAAEREKPIVLVKVGRSSVGGSMAQSHTGHLVGADEAFEAFFEQFGIVRVDDFDRLVEIGAALARCPVPTADGVVVCSVSGGTAAHVADLAALGGLRLPRLSAEAQAALSALIPPGFRIDNPVDNGGTVVLSGAGPDIWRACLRDPAIGIMLCPIPASAPGLTEGVGRVLVDAVRWSPKPILPIWSGPSTKDPVYQQLWDAGLPVFRNVGNAVAAARALLAHPARNAGLREQIALAREHRTVIAAGQESRLLDEHEATCWLRDRGLAFAHSGPADRADEAVTVAQRIGYPVVLKARGVSHKSELGLVVTGITDAGTLRAQAERMLAAGADGLLVAEQVTGGIELIVGVSTDSVLGPVLIVGAGGVTAEAVRDVSRSVLPLTRSRAEHMLDRLRIAPLLAGWRGQPGADREAIVDMLMRVAELAASGQIIELDINPVLARPDGVVGLDALLRVAAGPALD